VLSVGEFGAVFLGVCLCCVWDSILWVGESEFVLCVVQFGVGLGECVCVVCGTVWCGFGGVDVCSLLDSLGRVWGVSVCCVCDSLVWICSSESVLFVGKFGVVFWSECMLCVVQFCVGLGEWVCAVCGTVWCGFVGVSVYCLWESLLWVLWE